MSIRVIQATSPTWYTPTSQKDDDAPAQFKVKGLTGHEQAQVAPELSITSRGDLDFTAKGILLIFQLGLLDWRNVNDANDAPVEFSGKSAREIQDLLHYNDQVAIAGEIFNASFLALDDKKK